MFTDGFNEFSGAFNVVPVGFGVFSGGFNVFTDGFKMFPGGFNVFPGGFKVLTIGFNVFSGGFTVLTDGFNIFIGAAIGAWLLPTSIPKAKKQKYDNSLFSYNVKCGYGMLRHTEFDWLRKTVKPIK